MPRRTAGLVLALAASALLFAWWTGTAAAAKGTLEICKAGANVGGQTFDFTLTKGQQTLPASVTPPACSSPIDVAAGKWTITEDLSSGLYVMTGASTSPPSALVSENDVTGKVKVQVTAGAETIVTIENTLATATLKVCKWSSTPQFQGAQYDFTVSGGGGSLQAVAGSSKATAGCSAAIVVQPGANLTVTEAVPAGQQVANVTKSGKLVINSKGGGSASVTVGTGANILYFEDEPFVGPQFGKLEVCKNWDDNFAHPDVPFTVTDSGGASQNITVSPGQCTGPLDVAVGNVNVAENLPQANTELENVALGPNSAGSLGPVNLNNGTAIVVVPVSTAGEVQVIFTNVTVVTTLKICKYLTGTSGSLAGKTFTFVLTDDAGTQTVTVDAQTGSAGACKVVPVQVPVGSTVTTTEVPMPWVGVNGGAPGAGGTVVTHVVSGINNINFTNQAYGQFELCKKILAVDGDPNFNGTIFHFTADGGPAPDLAAGRCGQPIVVPAGTHTVKEVNLPYGFQFVASNATGPTLDNRCVPADNSQSPNCGNPITFSVPFFNDANNGGTTEVTFWNKVQRVSIKICKLIEPGSTTTIGGLSYNFKVFVNAAASPGATGSVSPPYPGANSCTGLLLSVPIIKANGSPAQITVTETLTPAFTVQSIAVDNIAPIPPGTNPIVNLGAGAITFNPGVGVDVVTFTNMAVPVKQNT